MAGDVDVLVPSHESIGGVGGVHERQLQGLAQRSERDGTPDRDPLATQDDPAKLLTHDIPILGR